MTFSPRFTVSFLIALGGLSAGARACSVCGCSLSSDWAAQGYDSMVGLSADLRTEYSNQDDLREGSSRANRASFAFPNDQEIQQDTLNRSLWPGIDDVLSSHWALNAQLPSYDRFHSTVAEGDTAVSTSRTTGLGDLRLVGRYQDFSLAHSWSLQAGFKLPTGKFDQDFDQGPQAGTLVDRGLQLGTGTTDFLAGASYFWRPQPQLGCFLQATVDEPLASRQQFTPSPSLGASTGLRWLNSSNVTPELQVNARWDGRESGAEADIANSGGVTLYASPGVSVGLGHGITSFAFVQLPVYQRLNGLQLEPKWVLSLGVRLRR